MKGDSVPSEHHILRYVGGRHIDRNADGEPVILDSGFIARPRDNNQPSYNWLECLSGSLREQIRQIRGATRIGYGATARLAQLNVGSVIRGVADGTRDQREVSVIHDPLDAKDGQIADPSHALMTNVPDEDDPEGELVGDLIADCVLRSFPARGD